MFWKHRHTDYLQCYQIGKILNFLFSSPRMFLTTCQCLSPTWWLVTGLSWSTQTPRLFFLPGKTCLSSYFQLNVNASPVCCSRLLLRFTTAGPEGCLRIWQILEMTHENEVHPQKTIAKMKTKGNSKTYSLWEKTEKPCGFKRGHKEREIIEADKNMEGWKRCVRDQNTIHIIQLTFCAVLCWRNLLLH